MNLKKFIIILFVILYFSATAIAEGDAIYLLKDNSSISLSKILSFQNDIISEYNKNFERYPPENKQLYHLFVLNQSFNSTILLSYYGSIGFAFQESKTPITTIMYWNQSQYGSFLGVPFGGGVYLKDNRYFNAFGYRYGFTTNVYDLTPDYLKELSTEYYLFDYAQYLSENAQLKQIEEENLQKLNKAAEELIKIYQSGNELEKAKATLQYYQLAEEVGYPDASAKKILEDLKNKNVTQTEATTEQKGFTYTPFLHTVITAIYFMIIAPFAFVRIERFKSKLEKQGKAGSVALISYVFDGVLAFGGLAYFMYQSPNKLEISQFVVIAVSIFIGIYLALKYEKPNRIEQQQSEEPK